MWSIYWRSCTKSLVLSWSDKNMAANDYSCYWLTDTLINLFVWNPLAKWNNIWCEVSVEVPWRSLILFNLTKNMIAMGDCYFWLAETLNGWIFNSEHLCNVLKKVSSFCLNQTSMDHSIWNYLAKWNKLNKWTK